MRQTMFHNIGSSIPNDLFPRFMWATWFEDGAERFYKKLIRRGPCNVHIPHSHKVMMMRYRTNKMLRQASKIACSITCIERKVSKLNKKKEVV